MISSKTCKIARNEKNDRKNKKNVEFQGGNQTFNTNYQGVFNFLLQKI